MSLDVFLQAFRDGDAAPADPAAIAAILTPFIVTREASFASLKTADGEADCYGLGSDSLTTVSYTHLTLPTSDLV